MIYNDTGLPLIRKAKVDDIEIVHRILNRYAQQGLLLPRSLSELYEHLREYFVLETEPSSEVRGVCGLGICWKDLAEIESLAVCEANQGKGFGLMLAEECLNEARSLGIKKVFTLTYVPDFFVKMGFEEIDKAVLPHKIWADCLKCPKFPDCDEIAMMLVL